MKKVEAIIRPCKLDEVLDELNKHQFYGITVTQVMGSGRQGSKVRYYRGNKYTVNLLPKTKLELVVKEHWVSEVIETIKKVACTGEPGDGVIFIYNVEDAFRIRTGETGEDAII